MLACIYDLFQVLTQSGKTWECMLRVHHFKLKRFNFNYKKKVKTHQVVSINFLFYHNIPLIPCARWIRPVKAVCPFPFWHTHYLWTIMKVFFLTKCLTTLKIKGPKQKKQATILVTCHGQDKMSYQWAGLFFYGIWYWTLRCFFMRKLVYSIRIFDALF